MIYIALFSALFYLSITHSKSMDKATWQIYTTRSTDSGLLQYAGSYPILLTLRLGQSLTRDQHFYHVLHVFIGF